MAALLEKSGYAAEDFFKNGELRYRTFKKKFAKVAGLLEKKSGHDPGIMGKILPIPGVLDRPTPNPPDLGCAHPGPY